MEPVLDFERPIHEAERALRRLAWRVRQGNTQAVSEYQRVHRERDRLLAWVYGNLTPVQRVALARHPARPHGAEAAQMLFGELEPIRGDRSSRDDPAIIAGIGRWRERRVMVVACERGRSKAQARRCNFGMPGPAGFRKAVRAMELAEHYALPLVTLVDTPGADPGVESERACVAEAIARTLWQQARVRIPTLGVVLGEGGSGGALALAMGDRMLIMQYAYFSVISPEACASILWRDAAKTDLAAMALKLLPEDLLAFGIVDEVVPEPTGGAHRARGEALLKLRDAVDRHLGELLAQPDEARLAARYARYRSFGTFAIRQETHA